MRLQSSDMTQPLRVSMAAGATAFIGVLLILSPLSAASVLATIVNAPIELHRNLAANWPGAATAWSAAVSWAQTQYQQTPTLMLCLSIILLLPVAAIIAQLMRRGTLFTGGSHRAHEKFGKSFSISALREMRQSAPIWPKKAVLQVFDPIRGHVAAQFPLSRPVVQIGRSVDVDIVINDPAVHRHHVAIHSNDNADYELTDLSAGTGNGVLVNGAPVLHCKIAHGDEIRLGRTRMRFVTAST